MNIKKARCKVKGYITIRTPGRISNKKGEVGWTPTSKLDLLHLVETKKIFYKGIMRKRLLKLKRRAEGFGA